MDVFLLIMVIIIAVLLFIINIYLLGYYCHPDDRSSAIGILCKIAVIVGMTLSWAQVLMLPLDVSNSRGEGGEIRMDLFWMIIYIATAVFLLFAYPVLSFYYEADSEWTCWEKIKHSMCSFVVIILVTIIILVVSYAFLSTAEVPISAVNCSLQNIQPSASDTFEFNTCSTTKTTLEIDVSFPIYCIAFMSFISWFLFVLFGGIGLPALPLDYIYDFRTRPQKISKDQINSNKEKIAKRALVLKDIVLECKDLEEKDVLTKNSCKNEFYHSVQ